MNVTEDTKLSEILINYCKHSHTNGLSFLVKKKHRIFWSLILISIASYCCYQCKLNLDNYLSYAISTKTSLSSISGIKFPAITFQPLYMWKRSTFGDLAQKDLHLTVYFSSGIDSKLIMDAVSDKTSFA